VNVVWASSLQSIVASRFSCLGVGEGFIVHLLSSCLEDCFPLSDSEVSSFLEAR
jgi:hypothetical protein